MSEESNDKTVNDTPKMVAMKNPKSGEMMQVTEDVRDLINGITAVARKDATEKAEAKFQPTKDALANLQSDNIDVMAELDKLKDSTLDDGQKLQKQYDRNVKELTDKLEAQSKETQSYKGKYEHTKIMTDVYGAFGEYKLASNEDTAVLFMNSAETNLEEKIDAHGKGTGEHQTMMKMVISDGNGGYKEIEGRPKEIFKQWIEQDSKRHLLANNLTPGGGSSHGGNVEGGSERDKLLARHAVAMKEGKITEALQIKGQLQALEE